MYLALHEMKKEKLRYGLVIGVILLVAYLIFILSALAQGLASQNTDAVNAWSSRSVILNKDANGNLAQSLLTKEQLADVNGGSLKYNQDLVGLAQGILKDGNARQSATFVGLQEQAKLKKKVTLSSGRWNDKAGEVVLSDQLKKQGFHLNQQVKMGLSDKKLTVVGFAKKSVYNMAPVVYGSLDDWSDIKGVTAGFVGSGIVSESKQSASGSNLQVLTKQELFNKMPGYSAQNQTFLFMIAFLIIISVVIVAIFLYILTMQKLENLAVLRAQGIPTSYLIWNTLGQTLLIMIIAVALAVGLAAATALVIPSAVPMSFDAGLITTTAVLLVLTGIIGAVIPMRIIAKIDPVSVIGG
ncbi:FtsX-like permease family protein [Fructobacillus durionis]|uniref:Putative hemin transport system permease protein HrtB n=1 Tax=Fructobacillus durionis TaxID=283737 RepID=A0A1I1GPQ6_9LACO|nr:ABC transporter permease [Fructobacillus durionis]SFC13737.1 putative ABC transport system permease protein [Fructobacillus durionis]